MAFCVEQNHFAKVELGWQGKLFFVNTPFAATGSRLDGGVLFRGCGLWPRREMSLALTSESCPHLQYRSDAILCI